MIGRVSYRCARCGLALTRLLAGPAPAPCARCGGEQPLRQDAVADGRLLRCPVCGLKVLYRQKDFRQSLGCLVVLVAAVLAPFTWYLSLVAAALLDALLYWIAPDVVVCYRTRCQARVRGVAPGPAVAAFDLSIHDYYRSIELGSLPDPEPTRDPEPPPPAAPG